MEGDHIGPRDVSDLATAQMGPDAGVDIGLVALLGRWLAVMRCVFRQEPITEGRHGGFAVLALALFCRVLTARHVSEKLLRLCPCLISRQDAVRANRAPP
jgi:hypothetical protein